MTDLGGMLVQSSLRPGARSQTHLCHDMMYKASLLTAQIVPLNFCFGVIHDEAFVALQAAEEVCPRDGRFCHEIWYELLKQG